MPYKDPEKSRQQKIDWAINNPEKVRECEKKRYRTQHRQEYLRRYNEINKEARRKYFHNYEQRNRARRVVNASNRKARIKGNGGVHSLEEEMELFAWQKGECHYCGEWLYINMPFHVEHKTPIRRGGSNDIDNIALTCPHCNVSKGIKTEEEFRCIQ